jgi:hypothetical protein
MMRICDIPSEAGATCARKSEGVIHGGTASTPTITPSQSALLSTDDANMAASWASEERILAESRNIWTMPSGIFVKPVFVCLLGTKVACAGPSDISMTLT